MAQQYRRGYCGSTPGSGSFATIASRTTEPGALALAVARRWPGVLSNAVDPGWVPTKMGGPGAPDDLTMGHLTQTWLAVSDELAVRVSGGYWYHRNPQKPAADALDPEFQDRLMAKLAELSGFSLF